MHADTEPQHRHELIRKDRLLYSLRKHMFVEFEGLMCGHENLSRYRLGDVPQVMYLIASLAICHVLLRMISLQLSCFHQILSTNIFLELLMTWRRQDIFTRK